MPIRRFTVLIRALSESGKLAGLLLLLATVLSLMCSNMPVGPSYRAFWATEFSAGSLPNSLEDWVNNGLMAVFFFLVGLEIKRELLVGGLATPRQALLPAVAAVGGVLVPALIYLAFNQGTPYITGWAIPTATDIAFSLGILTLLGKQVPPSLRIFLTTLAIIDDLLAVAIIALFYAGGLHWEYLGVAGLLFGILLLLNKLRIWSLLLYLSLGILLWFCVLQSGIHATVAGVLLAAAIPLRRIPSLEHALRIPVNYFILPAFALCNTAVLLPVNALNQLSSNLALGTTLALVFGKPLGIVGTVGGLVRRGWAQLPEGANWSQMLGLGFTAGIGFTMAIFIATLSFSDPNALSVAKLAVLLGSAVAGIVGACILGYAGWKKNSGAKVRK